MFHGQILGELPPERSRLEELGLLMTGKTLASTLKAESVA